MSVTDYHRWNMLDVTLSKPEAFPLHNSHSWLFHWIIHHRQVRLALLFISSALLLFFSLWFTSIQGNLRCLHFVMIPSEAVMYEQMIDVVLTR